MRLKEIMPLSLYHRWLENSRYFECFLRTGPFVTLKHYHDFELSESASQKDDTYRKINRLIRSSNTNETIILLDLPGETSIIQGYLLNNHNNIKPIPVLNFLLHDYGLVGSEAFVNNLIVCGLNLKTIEPQGFAFILDYSRYKEFSEEEQRKGFNNQYELFDENLPSVEMLKALAIKKILYITEYKVKEDIGNYLQYLGEHEIEVSEIFLEEVSLYE